MAVISGKKQKNRGNLEKWGGGVYYDSIKTPLTKNTVLENCSFL